MKVWSSPCNNFLFVKNPRVEFVTQIFNEFYFVYLVVWHIVLNVSGSSHSTTLYTLLYTEPGPRSQEKIQCIVTTWTFIAVARSHRKARANLKPKSEISVPLEK